MMKVVINNDYGGFFIPTEVRAKLKIHSFGEHIERNNPELVKWVETHESDLAVVEIPDNAHYVIEETDGWETLYWSETPIHLAKPIKKEKEENVWFLKDAYEEGKKLFEEYYGNGSNEHI